MPSTNSSGELSSPMLFRPRIWIEGPAPRRPVLGAMTTPGARAPINELTLCAADLEMASSASIVDTALPIDRRSSPPAVPVTTTSSRAAAAGSRSKLTTTGSFPRTAARRCVT
jgi:hypothetical protein